MTLDTGLARRIGVLVVYGFVLWLFQSRKTTASEPAGAGSRHVNDTHAEESGMVGADAGVGGAHGGDRGPGEDRDDGHDVVEGLRNYLIGLGIALLLTAASFLVASGSTFVWQQAVPIALVVLAIAQIGVHLVFFLHITTGPDNTNNALALAFGTLIVFLVLAGTLWIMSHLNANMMPLDEIMKMQR